MTFDGQVFSSSALLATAYWCADKCIATIANAAGKYDVSFRPVGDFKINQAFLDRFEAMAVHNQIREQLKSQFKDVELAIVKKAFAPIECCNEKQ